MKMKVMHERIGMVNEDFTEIECYVHQRHNIGECPWCDFRRIDNLTKEFLWRLDNCGHKIRRLHMWSLGTSLMDGKYNRVLLLGYWRRFSNAIRHYGIWSPIFRIVEVGRHGFLHIHVVCTDYIDHADVLKMWRYQTGESSNVHVSAGNKYVDPCRLARYLMKYLSKESSSYRFLGVFYGLQSSRSRSIGRGVSLRYGGICYGGFQTDGYEISEPQQSIYKNVDL